MNNQEKDYILRVLFISCSAAPADIHFDGHRTTPRTLADNLKNQEIKISFVTLIPYCPLQRKYRGATGGIAYKSMPNALEPPDVYEIRWPVFALRGAAKFPRFWPGAEFAFPFACSKLVTLMQSQPWDILLADDLEFSGQIAWRLHEITGVPYVIMDGSTQHFARDAQSDAQNTARHRRLGAIQRDAEFILDFNSAAAAIRTSLYPDIHSRILYNPEPTPSGSVAEVANAEAISRLGQILHEAVRQSTEIFDW